MSTKISKACEPCRLRKTRCNGCTPCQRRECKEAPQSCVYRPKARIRKSLKQQRISGATATSSSSLPTSEQSTHRVSGIETPATAWSDQGDDDEGIAPGAQPDVYHSVTETHLSPKSTDSSQLFYGPSSNFAFLQQVHRGILSAFQHDQPDGQQGRSGLDTFMQRSIFFGTPCRIDPEAIRSPNIQLPAISKVQAREFLEEFKTISYYRLPFYTFSELDILLDALYNSQEAHAIPPQTKANLLAILAIGALSTPYTDLAETLIVEAKREVVIFDDAVTLQMLQLCILFSDYQINMGRPNSTYLHLGVACRKAFALGLHTEALTSRLDEATLQNHRTTLWLLYFYETCQALTLGRRSGMKLSDIACPFPDEPTAIARLCCIAKIMEETAESIYRKKADHIRQLYANAEGLHTKLRQFAEAHGIASAHTKETRGPSHAVESLTLHNLYYLAVILIFRPFLVASYAMRTSGVRDSREMWLRQACRYAVDAAQDSIVFANNMLANNRTCRGLRYQAFFIECSCAVLLYDILCQPSKYTYNMEYIKKAMKSLEYLVADEPVTTALNSIRRVLGTIEKSIANQTSMEILTTPPQANSVTPPPHYSNIQFPPLNQFNGDGGEQMIYLTDGTGPVPNAMCPSTSDVASSSLNQDWLNPSHFNLNVMTTDLFNFLPMNMSTPLDYPTGRTDGST